MNHTEQAKEQMLNECRLAYENDENGLKSIELFRSTYTSDQAAKWYTADSFIYRLLNRTLRYRENFENVYKFRYFIADLHRQLRKMQGNFKATTVYRGQMMNKHELDMFKENRGKCMSVNTFLSTTLDEAVARCYAGDGEERPKLESVLFVIHIDYSITNIKPFASLMDDTRFKDEEEVLFSVGSVFEISEHIDLISGTNIWRIELKTSNIQNQHVIDLMNYFMDEIYYDTKDMVLGKFLIYMGKYKDAENYFNDIRRQIVDNDQRPFYVLDLHMSLGVAYHYQTNYIQAEALYDLVIKHWIYQTNLNYLKCRNQLGKLYLDKECYDMADFQFDCVLSSLKEYKEKNQKKYCLLLAETYINIASSQLEADNSYVFESEKVFQLLCLAEQIYRKILPRNHPLFAELRYYFGCAYFIKDINDMRALDNLQHSMNIQLLSLPKNHIQRVKIHFRLGKFYFAQKQYSEGLQEFGKIIDIQVELLDEADINHPLITKTFTELGLYYQKIDRLIQALKYFQLALQQNSNEKLEPRLELDIEICKQIIKCHMDAFAMNDLSISTRENNHDIRQLEILCYQDDNENILDMAMELQSTGVHFSNFGTKLKFDRSLTLQQTRTLCGFIRNGSDIQYLIFLDGVCEDEVGWMHLTDALAVNDTMHSLSISQSMSHSHKISKNVCQAFATAIKVNKTLTELSLTNFSNPRMTLLLFDALLDCSRLLTNLCISEIKISNKAAQYLSEMLKCSKVIAQIDLKNTKLTSCGSKFIAFGLQVNDSLVSLNLSHNEIRCRGCRAIGNALKLNKTLSTLYISYNKVKSSGMQSIGEALSINQSLTKLFLNDNNIGCIGAAYIASGLKSNKTLKILSLSFNKISNYGATTLGDSLRINTTLYHLDISHNLQLLSSNSLSFAEGIHLKILHLSGIHLCDSELQFLVSSLVSSTNLTKLELEFNELSADGCIFIEHLLKNNNTLNELALSYNKLTDLGLKYICEGLAVNKALETIHLNSCAITDYGMDSISEMLKKNKVLTRLKLRDNKITEIGVDVLKESLKFNRVLEQLNTDSFEITETDRYSELDKNQTEIAQAQTVITTIANFFGAEQKNRSELYDTQLEDISNEILVDNTDNSSVKYIYDESGLCVKHIVNEYDNLLVVDGDALLHQQSLYRKEILKDGNNFFRAISDCIHGNDSRCDFYRQCAIDYVKKNPNEFYEHTRCFNPTLSVDDYLVNMADSTKPADTVLIRSLCQQMNVNLIMHRLIFQPVIICVNENNRDEKQLHLYTSDFGKYFDSVHSHMQPDETLTNIFIEPNHCTEDPLFFFTRSF
ncbi:unnamed protein product [Adineta steineri]|uniref:NAD(P)(+)--arginine ADP-ribosyltransferase n=1 Tax=Adineta steineri TaxID=433720 RepID=A0A815SNH3_9BILA|nr:unnamed protein product [Adineta steineri]